MYHCISCGEFHEYGESLECAATVDPYPMDGSASFTPEEAGSASLTLGEALALIDRAIEEAVR